MKRLFAMILLLPLLFAGSQAIPAQAQATNLLKNPGFEQPYNGDGAATDWVRWHRESSADKFDDCTKGYRKQPRWGNATDTVHSGSTSQFIGNNWDTWGAGVWQTVSVTPGARYRFTFYGRGFGSMESDGPSDRFLDINMRAGIDPNGSGLWSDADVVWSAAASPHDTWQQFAIEVTATGDKVTVFTSADYAVEGKNQCFKFLNTFFDTAELIELGPPPTNTPPPPPPPPAVTNTPLPPTATNTPEFTPTPEATATFTPVPTATTPPGGTVCLNAFGDENANGVQDDGEGFVAGVTLTVASGTEIVAQAVSPGSPDPVCFDGIPAGNYQVTQQVASSLEMTTAASATVNVSEGGRTGVSFGSRLRRADSGGAGEEVAAVPTAVSPTTAADGSDAAADGFDFGAISGILVLVLAVIVLGVVVFTLQQRRAS